MSLILVKTVSDKCKCGSEHFIKSGIAWSCSGCGAYVPAKLEKRNSFEELRSNLNNIQTLHARLKGMLKEVEDMVRK